MLFAPVRVQSWRTEGEKTGTEKGVKGWTLTKTPLHPQGAPEGGREICFLMEITILGLLYTLPYLPVIPPYEKTAVVIHILHIRKIKGYVTYPALHKLQAIELEVKPSFL